MKKQTVKNLTIFIVLLALIAGAFSCGFFTNDVAYAAVLPDAVSNQWFDGEDYNNFNDTLQAINKIKDGLSTAEKADFKNNPVLVAVIDTGINASHELFDGVLCDEGLWYNAITHKNGRDYINDTCNNGTLVGHGTHVAGIVAQEIKKCGLEDYIKILPVKAGDSNGRFDAVAVVDAISYVKDLATQDKQDKQKKTIVINMSLTNMIRVNQWGMSTRNFQGHGIPTLYDEWAHPACYTYTTLQTDPNIREFWGKSIDMMWSGLFDAPGGLGGAIWGYIDETFALPEPKEGTSFWKEFAHTAKPKNYQGNCVGYGEWGIVDVWRRPKPEFWSTKKAYSPIRLLAGDNLPFTAGQPLILTVYNRFDHTDLNEIQASYTYKGVTKNIQPDPIKPHQKGMLMLSAEQWEENEPVLIEFFTTEGKLIDAYRPILGTEMIDYPSSLSGQKLSITDKEDKVTVSGEGFEIPFDKNTGLIVNATAGGKVIIEKGPFLNLYINLNHLTGAEIRKAANYFATADTDWKKKSFSYRQQADGVYITLSGTYKEVNADFNLKITPSGELSVHYRTIGVPNGFLRETGLSFYLSDAIQQLNWKRKGYWNYYPEGEFAGNEGNTPLYQSQQAAYGKKPTQPWHADTHNYYYWADAGTNCQQPLTQTAKGMKENIYYYSLSSGDKDDHRLSVISTDASVACRLSKRADEQLILYTNNRWDYPEIAWGNYCKTQEALPCYGQINLRLK